MSLVLEPLTVGEDPWSKIVTTLGAKIASEDLSLHKYLNSLGLPDITVFDQTGELSGSNVWEPTADQCPAIVLLVEPHPAVDDDGAGAENWFVDVSVDFKMNLREADATVGFQAAYELIRTIFAGWRPGLADDPLSALPAVSNYQIVGEVIPHISAGSHGRWTGRCFFVLRFTISDTILG